MPDAPVRPARQPPDPARHGYRPCASSSSRPPPPSSPDPSATTTPPPPASPPKPAKPGTNTHPATTHSEPFSSCDLAGLKDVDGLGQLPGAPGAAAELAQDVPGFQ